MIEIKIDRAVSKIGVVSDTHIPTRGRKLPPQLFKVLDGVQLILHAGDLVDERILEELRALAPVEAVAGNMDPPQLQSRLGKRKLVKAGGVEIGLMHGEGAYKSAPQRALEAFCSLRPQAVVFGHTHMPLCEYKGELLLFNPGSAVDPRCPPAPSCGILTVERSGIRGEIIYLE